jgi:hypothetical protein
MNGWTGKFRNTAESKLFRISSFREVWNTADSQIGFGDIETGDPRFIVVVGCFANGNVLLLTDQDIRSGRVVPSTSPHQ